VIVLNPNPQVRTIGKGLVGGLFISSIAIINNLDDSN